MSSCRMDVHIFLTCICYVVVQCNEIKNFKEGNTEEELGELINSESVLSFSADPKQSRSTLDICNFLFVIHG
ncbi:hypothetical protein KP509_23G023600 [Ceratopteris richardii]|uniref:Uncharacterized protein n=1 Tax=Ceratopteris richardii TaxID=49495 RepID=A0A8T2RY09_CERRI|nr:hypothetical protein KP509_23G023600 [Ceratopteris richardii]